MHQYYRVKEAKFSFFFLHSSSPLSQNTPYLSADWVRIYSASNVNERPDREKKESSSIVARKSETDLSLHPRMTMEQKMIERISSTGQGQSVCN